VSPTLAVQFTSVVLPSHEAVVQPLSLQVSYGSVCVIQAPAVVCGQVLRLCTGLLPPDAGRVEVLGEEPSILPRSALQCLRRSLGVALQPGGLVSNLTLKMNLVVPLLYSGAAELSEAAARAEAMLARFGLEAWSEARPSAVPADVRAQTVVARALIGEPKLLLLDDPLNGLQMSQAETVLGLLHHTGRTLVITTPQASPALDSITDRTEIWSPQSVPTPRYNEVGTN
jgi:ABC-type transporter Mla maintaining outer membrane lipid asymmetry ATPase subunit MlaF